MKASIALQVLPLSQGIDRIAVIDQVIAYLQVQEVTMVVTPFETVLEGEFDPRLSPDLPKTGKTVLKT